MSFIKNKFTMILVLSASIVFLTSSAIAPDEGMFPLSEIKNLDLKKAGLSIDQNDLYNPNGISLIDALVNIGGCTGSFVSADGLIITNHHCSVGAVQQASTPEKDYLTNGFIAPTKDKEIEAKGMPVRITDSYEDVSQRVLSSATGIIDPIDRNKAINAKMQEIAKEEEAKDKTIKAEVSEMFIGKTYVLFRYKMIQDVRLVYIPRESIGWFGGETDNWVWPRHTGDYSFVRAYVAPDGSTAPYSKNNVPYKPKKFLKINPNGIAEEDFVFILGYPARTFRHRPSQYLEYQYKYFLPYLSELYDWQIQQMQQTGFNDKSLEIKQAARVRKLANATKNYKGKLQGLERIGLIEQKREEEKQLQAYINSDPQLKDKYGRLLEKIDDYYKVVFSDVHRDLWFQQIYSSTNLLAAANVVNNLKIKLNEFDAAKRVSYLKENNSKIKASIDAFYTSYVEETDKRLLKRMLIDALKVPDNQRILGVDNLFKGKNEKAVGPYIDKLYKSTQFKSKEFAMKIPDMTWEELFKLKDPMLSLVDELNNQFVILQQENQKREGTLKQLMADFIDLKSAWKKASFIPDANATLRLTYGYVRGYSPADAVYNSPFTTIKGILEKANTGPDFKISNELKQIYQKKDLGMFAHSKLNDVPVAFLYNLDTSGGNSGSPIMNSKGELVGVNFDRAYTATINDFAYNEAYSRAIGIDIRYVLWAAQKVDKADFLLTELGVKP